MLNEYRARKYQILGSITFSQLHDSCIIIIKGIWLRIIPITHLMMKLKDVKKVCYFFNIRYYRYIHTHARTNTHAHTGVQFLHTRIMSTGSTKLPVNPYRTKCICCWDDSLEALHSFIFYYLTSYVDEEVAIQSRGCYQRMLWLCSGM